MNSAVSTRSAGKVSAEVSFKVKEVVVDFSSKPSIVAALRGHNAVVSTLGTTGLVLQETLIETAIESGVPRFIPSGFGNDLQNPISHALPMFAEKVKVQEYLEKRSKNFALSCTFVYNNLFLDWGLRVGFIAAVVGKKATIYNEGSFPIGLTRLSIVGKAVVAVLKYIEATKNQIIRSHDGKLTKRDIIEAIQCATSADGWIIDDENTFDVQMKSDKFDPRVSSMSGWLGYIVRASRTEEAKPGFFPAE